MSSSLKKYQLLQPKKTLTQLETPHPIFLTELTVNPYKGCLFGCVTCYSIDDEEISSPYTPKIGVKTNIVSQLRQKLLELGSKKIPIAVGNYTDPYQPAEKELRITRNCLEIIIENKFPVQIFTKSDLILRDIDLLEAYSRENMCTVNVTLTMIDETQKEIFEPFAPSVESRLKLISELRERNIPVGVLFAPVMPFINDTEKEIETIVRRSKKSGANYLIPAVLSLDKEVVRKRTLSVIDKYYNQYLSHYENLYANSKFPDETYTEKISGQIIQIAEKYKLPMQIPVTGATPVRDIRVELL